MAQKVGTKGNPRKSRRVVCPNCKRQRHTTAYLPWCKGCDRKMDEA